MEFSDVQTGFGRVVANKADFFIVEFEDIKSTQACQASQSLPVSAPFRFLCKCRSRLIHKGEFVFVGDYVSIDDIDWRSFRAVISDIHPRKSLFIRPPVANAEQIIVALSFDQPSFDIDQATRFLISAEQSNLDIIFLLTKRDLLETDDVQKQLQRFNLWGYDPIAISTKTGQGIDDLYLHLKKAKITLICGPSGVGKSSLLKRLMPNMSILIGDLSRRLKRGKNTTRHVELYSLQEGLYIADTPGFNRPDIQVKPKHLAFYFPELRNQLIDYPCKFRDCLHMDELGCAIDKNFERYSIYNRFLQELMH